jgi:hypothetical protein
MKALWLGLPLLCLPMLGVAELSVKRIDKMVAQIQGKRISKVNVDFRKVASPFAVMVQRDVNATPVLEMPERQVSLKLSAIINDRARINGRWIETGGTIEGYKVESITENRVVLQKGDRTVELFLPNPEKNNLLQISEG